MKLKLGDKFTAKVEGATIKIEIVGLGIDVKFLVSGQGVENPEQPREMPAVAFVPWLKLVNAAKSV